MIQEKVITGIAHLFLPSAGAYGKQVMALLNLLSQPAHVRRASVPGERKVCPGGCPGRDVGWIPGASHLLMDPTPLNWHHPLHFSSPMPSEALHNVIIHCTKILLLASDSFAGNFLVAALGEKIHSLLPLKFSLWS